MPIVRLPGGDLRDEIRQPLYDTLVVAQNDTSAKVGFSILSCVGPNANQLNNQAFFSAVQGKQAWESNLRQNNMLETAVSFRLQGMSLDADYASSPATLSADQRPTLLPMIQSFGSLKVRIGEKDYWNGPLVFLMGRIVGNGGTGIQQHAGQPAVQGIVLAGRHVVDINPLQSFNGTINMSIPSNVAGLTTDTSFPALSLDMAVLKFSFKGLLRRPVQ